MKTIIALLFACSSLLASDVPLAWDASETPGCTYRLYCHTNSLSYDLRTNAVLKVNAGTNLTARAECQPGKWYFWATALKDGLESDFSNMVIAEVPKAPGQMRTIVLQYSATLTNFVDAGFIKVRIP